MKALTNSQPGSCDMTTSTTIALAVPSGSPDGRQIRPQLVLGECQGNICFPEMGVPLFIIHVRLGFSLINYPFLGSPLLWKPPSDGQPVPMIFVLEEMVGLADHLLTQAFSDHPRKLYKSSKDYYIAGDCT